MTSYSRHRFDISAVQYHGALDALWAVLGEDAECDEVDDTVFTLVVKEIKGLRSEVERTKLTNRVLAKSFKMATAERVEAREAARFFRAACKGLVVGEDCTEERWDQMDSIPWLGEDGNGE